MPFATEIVGSKSKRCMYFRENGAEPGQNKFKPANQTRGNKVSGADCASKRFRKQKKRYVKNAR